MLAIVMVLCGLLGLAVGSFLNVVIWRVPRGESVVHPPSACPGCGQPIAPRDNLPILSWLLLRGRARCCGMRISVRYPLVEAFTALAWVGCAYWTGVTWVLPAVLYLATITIALTLIDIDHKRLPDVITLPSYPAAALLLGVATVGTGAGLPVLLRAGLAGLVMLAFYFVLFMIHPRGMGLGDVKLSGVLGLYLGWFGWGELAVGAFSGFLLGGLYGVVLLLLRRATRKSAIPFGPFMMAGAWVGLVVGDNLFAWYLDSSGF